MSIGISGSVTVARHVVRGRHRSPPPRRVRAGDHLHLGEHPAERLGVQAVAAGAAADAGQRRACRDARRRSIARTCSSTTSTSSATVAGSTPTPLGGRVGLDLVGARTARRTTATAAVRPASEPTARLLGALGEGEEPAAGVVAVVGELLDALGRDRRQHRGRGCRPASRRAPAGPARTAAAARSVCAKSPLATSTSRTLRNSPASRKNASASSGGTGEPSGSAGTTAGSAAAARASSSRAWPSRSSAMLASAMSSSRSGAFGHHSESRWERTRASSAEHQAVRRERAVVDAVRDGRVDAGQRVLEVGAEGPLRGVAAEQPVVELPCASLGSGAGCEGCGSWCSRSSDFQSGSPRVVRGRSEAGDAKNVVGCSHVGDVVGDGVERRVPVDLVAARGEQRVLLVGARRGDSRRSAPPRC